MQKDICMPKTNKANLFSLFHQFGEFHDLHLWLKIKRDRILFSCCIFLFCLWRRTAVTLESSLVLTKKWWIKYIERRSATILHQKLLLPKRSVAAENGISMAAHQWDICTQELKPVCSLWTKSLDTKSSFLCSQDWMCTMPQLMLQSNPMQVYLEVSITILNSL